MNGRLCYCITVLTELSTEKARQKMVSLFCYIIRLIKQYLSAFIWWLTYRDYKECNELRDGGFHPAWWVFPTGNVKFHSWNALVWLSFFSFLKCILLTIIIRRVHQYCVINPLYITMPSTPFLNSQNIGRTILYSVAMILEVLIKHSVISWRVTDRFKKPIRESQDVGHI